MQAATFHRIYGTCVQNMGQFWKYGIFRTAVNTDLAEQRLLISLQSFGFNSRHKWVIWLWVPCDDRWNRYISGPKTTTYAVSTFTRNHKPYQELCSLYTWTLLDTVCTKCISNIRVPDILVSFGVVDLVRRTRFPALTTVVEVSTSLKIKFLDNKAAWCYSTISNDVDWMRDALYCDLFIKMHVFCISSESLKLQLWLWRHTLTTNKY